MDAKDFHGFADELSNSIMTYQEANHRTIISRLYYGAFLSVQKWLETHYKQDYLIFKGSTHIRITKCLSHLAEKYNQPQIEDLAEQLRNFKGDRVTADYHLHIPVGDVNVQIAKQKRDEVMQAFYLVQLLRITMPNPQVQTK